MNNEAPNAPAGNATFYAAVWRWHFFAGIFVAPFAVFLAVTGAIYLWKPQFEAWRYRTLLEVTPAGQALSLDAQLEAARVATPGAKAQQFIPAPSPTRSAEVIFGSKKDGKVSVFVDPYTGKVLGRRGENERFMTWMHDLHGTLLAGTTGETLVELAASWAFVLVLTGLYLWWPRPFKASGFFWPRFQSGRRAFLKDLHAVPAVWFSVFTLILLMTGMQWTRVSGAWIKTLAQGIGEWQPKETNASAHRSELLGGWSPFLKDKQLSQEVANVASKPSNPCPPPITLENVRAIAEAQHVTDAYAIALPQGATGVFSVLSDRNRAFTRTYLHLDQYSGKVLADVRYKDFGVVAKTFTFGIILHEGQLFGVPNQIAGMLTCLAIILLAVTGLWMWWARRPKGSLGAPTSRGRFPRPLIAVVLVCAALAPLLAASLAVLALLDLVLKPRIQLLNSNP